MHAELRATSALQTKIANIIMRDPSSMNVISRAEEIIATRRDALLSDEVVEAGATASACGLWNRLTVDTQEAHTENTRAALSAALAKIGAQNVER